MPKPTRDIGFDLDELADQVNHYKGPAKPTGAKQSTSIPQEPAPLASAGTLGRPRTLPPSTPCSFRLSDEQRQWLITEAADRTLHSGKRHDASMIVRELIDQARGASI